MVIGEQQFHCNRPSLLCYTESTINTSIYIHSLIIASVVQVSILAAYLVFHTNILSPAAVTRHDSDGWNERE